MLNMSYCRFYNTSFDLFECLQAIDNEELSEINQDEKRAIKKMFTEQLERMNEIKEIIDDDYNGDIDLWLKSFEENKGE